MYQFAQALTKAENLIDQAVKAHNDVGWKWSGSFANSTVPLLWNVIDVRNKTGQMRSLCAVDYLREVMA